MFREEIFEIWPFLAICPKFLWRTFFLPFTQLEFSSINTPTFNVTSLTLGRDIIFACGLQQKLNRSPGNILKIEKFISGNRKWFKILTDWSKT